MLSPATHKPLIGSAFALALRQTTWKQHLCPTAQAPKAKKQNLHLHSPQPKQRTWNSEIVSSLIFGVFCKVNNSIKSLCLETSRGAWEMFPLLRAWDHLFYWSKENKNQCLRKDWGIKIVYLNTLTLHLKKKVNNGHITPEHSLGTWFFSVFFCLF